MSIRMSIIKWFRDRRAHAKADLRMRGYDYAAGELLRGVPIAEIEARAYDQFNQNEFNYGMQSAILAWDHMNYEKSIK